MSFIEEKEPARKKASARAHPAEILPPALVEPRRDREPSEAREKRVDEVGSKERLLVVLSNKSSPAKAPARPTWPIRSKSTLGSAADATSRSSRTEKKARAAVVEWHLDVNFMVRRAIRTCETRRYT